MTYLHDRLEPGDHYVNRYKRATLPCDSLLDKPDELAALSGPVKTYNVRDAMKGGDCHTGACRVEVSQKQVANVQMAARQSDNAS